MAMCLEARGLISDAALWGDAERISCLTALCRMFVLTVCCFGPMIAVASAEEPAQIRNFA